MARFLIEIPHDSDKIACAKVVRIFLSSGSHFLSNADWGCADGDHRAWMVVETPGREEALAIVPPGLRDGARVVQLVKFVLEPGDPASARVRQEPRAVSEKSKSKSQSKATPG
jgi:hypothetical protein